MRKYKTLAIGGQAGNGKNTLANHLISKFNDQAVHLGDTWCINAFANAVKHIFEETFQVDREFVERWKRNPKPPEDFLTPIRDCLITIGDSFRKMKANIWIDLAFRSQSQHQIIADLRYINEARYVKSYGGVTILLWRPGFENDIPSPSEQELMPYVRKLAKLGIEGNVPSELDIPFDFFIICEEGVDNLYHKADEIILPYLTEHKFI